MKAFIVPAFCALGISGLGFMAPQVSPIANPPIRQSGLDAHDGSTSGSMLGQFRTNISSWLWVRTDLYLHNGVMMRPITRDEQRAGVTIESSAKDGKEPLHPETMVTVVPSAARDFRGIVGDVDRAVNAYKDMHHHTHNAPEQTLPLFRLMTWLDPQFIQAWTTGGVIFARDGSPQGTNRAIEFLREGLAANPDNVDILTNLAYVYITREKSLSAAIPLLERARSIGHRNFDHLDQEDRAALEATYRWLGMCYQNTGRPDRVLSVTEEGSLLFPQDTVIQLIHSKPNDRAPKPNVVNQPDSAEN